MKPTVTPLSCVLVERDSLSGVCGSDVSGYSLTGTLKHPHFIRGIKRMTNELPESKCLV